jgi:hypothetical protein
MIMEFSHQDHDPIASHITQRRSQVEELYKGVVPPRSWTQVASHTTRKMTTNKNDRGVLPL